MPERSFGRTVRYRRTQLGLSQAKLGELVGRSPSTIRSWERDRSAPNEAAVLHALAAILGVNERALFEKAGQEPPGDVDDNPTVEQALATLRPTEAEPRETTSERAEEPVEEGEDELETMRTASEYPDPDTTTESESDQFQSSDTDPVTDESPAVTTLPRAPEPGYVAPPEPYVITPPTPPLVEPSYMEDPGQRQIYRVRTLATLVIAVGLAIALIWALTNGLDAIGTWWDNFFGNLRL